MKRSFLLLTAVIGVLTACNNESSNNKTTDSTEIIAEDTTFTATKAAGDQGQSCYAYTKNRDTVTMTLDVAGEEYTGKLNYKFFEKDKNSGTFAGEMKGDTLIAEYTFDSEGMRSVREVVFLRKDGQLHEGFGETTEKGTKVMYKDRSKLQFGDAIVLSKVPCK
ncbi:MAG: hypothetical protein V4594_19905 [Bacteroidota bacterium]